VYDENVHHTSEDAFKYCPVKKHDRLRRARDGGTCAFPEASPERANPTRPPRHRWPDPVALSTVLFFGHVRKRRSLGRPAHFTTGIHPVCCALETKIVLVRRPKVVPRWDRSNPTGGHVAVGSGGLDVKNARTKCNTIWLQRIRLLDAYWTGQWVKWWSFVGRRSQTARCRAVRPLRVPVRERSSARRFRRIPWPRDHVRGTSPDVVSIP